MFFSHINLKLGADKIYYIKIVPLFMIRPPSQAGKVVEAKAPLKRWRFLSPESLLHEVSVWPENKVMELATVLLWTIFEFF